MRKTKSRKPASNTRSGSARERGMGLIILILVMSCLMVLGLGLLSLTGTGPATAVNVRTQQQAFNAGEAGFDAAWQDLASKFNEGLWSGFEGRTLTEPNGIDDPGSTNYFRNLSDEEFFALVDSDGNGIPNLGTFVFFQQPYVILTGGGEDTNITYTAFLIDDEGGTGETDPSDALLVCIGSVNRGGIRTTSRIEVELALEDDE